MIFDYIALNKSNSKVEGEITAENLDSARDRLHGMGLTILSVNARKEEDSLKIKQQKTQKKDFVSFEFKGIDQKGKEIIGTIDAKDALVAYLRLKNEFLFDVKYIFDLDSSEIERERQKKELVQELQKQYELTKQAEKEREEKKDEEDLVELEQANIAKLEILRNQVNVMIAQIKAVMGKIQNDVSKSEEISQIKTLIGELERIKMSNNIKHIKSVAERILEIAETLFKGQAEYQVVIKQKEDLKTIDFEKIQQVQSKQAAEIKGISGALNKASELFKKYIGKIGIDLEKREKKLEKKVLEKEVLGNQQLANELDLVKKNKFELRQDLKMNFRSLFGKKSSIEKKTAWLNLKALLKAYFARLKIKEEKEENSKTFWEKLFGNRKLDLTKKDYQNVFVEINHFLGWLVCFYVIYFIFGGLILQKNLAFLKTFFYRTIFSEFLLLLLFVLFVFHLLTNLKIKFLRQSFWGAFGLFFVGVFSVLFYALNF